MATGSQARLTGGRSRPNRDWAIAPRATGTIARLMRIYLQCLPLQSHGQSPGRPIKAAFRRYVVTQITLPPIFGFEKNGFAA